MSNTYVKRISIALWVVLGVVAAHLGWTWLERHNGDLRMARRLEARRTGIATPDSSGNSVRITEFYAMAGEMTDADRNTVCYGVRNAKSVRIEPPVANVWPSMARCFWVEPRQDTTYRLIAEGPDGSQTSAAFLVRVKPAPPSILFMAVSHKEIRRGDAVTVCYGVDHARAVRIDPIGWKLDPIAKNCVRFYPKITSAYTLVASGAGGAVDTDRFRVAVRP